MKNNNNYKKNKTNSKGGKRKETRCYDERDEFQNNNKRSTRNNSSRNPSTNHVDWFVPNSEMLTTAANIPFGYRTGDALGFGDGNHLINPGVVAMEYLPTYGDMEDHASPINVAANAVYSFIRHQNSGSKNYDATDLMLYLMAMDSIYTAITWCRRVLNVAMLYSSENRYLPSALITAMGVNPTSGFYGDLNSWTNRLQNVVMKISSLAVPAVFPMYERHAYMTSLIYTDEDNQRAQLYLFNPRYLYTFAYDDEGKGMLKRTPWVHGAAGFTTYIKTLEDMVESIYMEEDAGIMSGDIMKAYGSNLVSLAMPKAGEILVPLHDVDFLNEIHNATIVNAYADDITQVITESGDGLIGYLRSGVHVQSPSDLVLRAYTKGKLLDLHNNPNPESVMRSTRFMFGELTLDESDVAGVTYDIHHVPSEVIVGANIYVLDEYGDLTTHSYGGPTTYGAASDLIRDASKIAYFPPIYLDNGTSNLIIMWNTDKTTTISNTNIDTLNKVAVLGLFNVDRLTLKK